MVEGVDDKVHAVGDEGHDDAQDDQEDPVLDLAEALAPHQRQELGCAPVLEGWSKWILRCKFQLHYIDLLRSKLNIYREPLKNAFQVL